MKGWWRRNIVWLVAIPFVLALLAVASSYRIWILWDEQPLRHLAAEAAPGEPLVFDQDYVGIDGAERREGTVEVVEIEELDAIPDEYGGDPTPLPEGSELHQVTLRFEAPPTADLDRCDVMLVDADGDRYGEGADETESISACSRGDDLPENPEKWPTEWDVVASVLTPEGVDLTQVWLSFEFVQKEYFVLRLR